MRAVWIGVFKRAVQHELDPAAPAQRARRGSVWRVSRIDEPGCTERRLDTLERFASSSPIKIGRLSLSAREFRIRSTEGNWSRVGKLKPGTEIVVTVPRAQPGTRYVVLTDEFDLTTLNLTDPGLPAERISARLYLGD